MQPCIYSDHWWGWSLPLLFKSRYEDIWSGGWTLWWQAAQQQVRDEYWIWGEREREWKGECRVWLLKEMASPHLFHWECEKIERGNTGSWVRWYEYDLVIKRHYAPTSTLHQQMAVARKWEKEQKKATQHIPQAGWVVSANLSAFGFLW